MFFLKSYWEKRPEQRENIRSLVNSRRLRLTSSGITTADTLLPKTEAILRDFFLGQDWLRSNGMEQVPVLGYFPDSFGYSHSLPSLLNSAGFNLTGITRVDGMTFLGCDLDFPWKFPRPGSSAELLMKKEKTLDFIWRDTNGGEVLCHWNAFTYGQGDMLAYGGIQRVYMFRYFYSDRSDRSVARKIRSFTRQLLPYSRTPYLSCPIGYDFVEPIPDLVTLLDRHNQQYFSKTGVWVVNAGLDDYLELVSNYRDRLPVLDLDPNPYWTGFYSARPSLKHQSAELVDKLVLAEALALSAGRSADTGDDVTAELAAAWEIAAVSNHHDFITGTSKDEVVQNEQEKWLKEGTEIVDALLNRLEPDPAAVASIKSDRPEWRLQNGLLEIDTTSLHLELAEEAGGCITRATDPHTLHQLLGSPSNDLISYQDSGGLWRMANEYPGGVYHEVQRSSQRPVRFEVQEQDGFLKITYISEMDGISITRSLWVGGEWPAIHFRVEGRAAEGRTLSAHFDTGINLEQLVMDEPGGVVTRPYQKYYQPTYWPFQSFIHLAQPGSGSSVAFFRGMSGAGAYLPGGAFDLVTHRNAVHETAFGFIHFPGMPVTGHERLSSALDYGIVFLEKGNWLENNLFSQARKVLQMGAPKPTAFDLFQQQAGASFRFEPDFVQILAIKPAASAPGVILRIFAPQFTGQPVTVTPLVSQVKMAFLCDARERQIHSLEVHDGQISLTMPGSIASILLQI
jgi:hypothetical protein